MPTTTPIAIRIVTPLIDGQIPDRKFHSELTLMVNKDGGTGYIRYSDDDYTTWSTFLPLHTWLAAPRARRLGASYRRAFEFRHIDAASLRTEGLDLIVEKGVY